MFTFQTDNLLSTKFSTPAYTLTQMAKSWDEREGLPISPLGVPHGLLLSARYVTLGALFFACSYQVELWEPAIQYPVPINLTVRRRSMR